MAEAVIFDMDGVIYDSEPGYFYGINKVLGQFGKQVSMEYNNKYIGGSSRWYWTDVIKKFDLNLTVESGIRQMNEFRKELLEKEGMKSIDGALELLHILKCQGIPLALASSSTMSQIKEVVETFQITDCFQAFLSGEECTRQKPDSEIFLRAAEELNILPKDCLVIEDSVNGITAAKKAGMKTIGYHNTEFGSSKVDDADHVVTSMRDITIKLCREM
jgi:HAD superfamily hydrolase (TIGR01509 family)